MRKYVYDGRDCKYHAEGSFLLIRYLFQFKKYSSSEIFRSNHFSNNFTNRISMSTVFFVTYRSEIILNEEKTMQIENFPCSTKLYFSNVIQILLHMLLYLFCCHFSHTLDLTNLIKQFFTLHTILHGNNQYIWFTITTKDS